MPLTTDSDTWVLVNLRMLNVSTTDSGTWVLVNLRMLDVSTTDSGTKVLVNLRMLDVSHNRLRYLGLVNLRMLDVSSALSRIFLRRCTLNARKGLQRQILCRLCKSRAVLFCAESFILIFFSQKRSFWQNYFCLLIRVRFMTTKKYCGTASVL